MLSWARVRRALQRLRGSTRPREVEPAAGYNLWAATYDEQPSNLMLCLDEKVFTHLLPQVDLQNKIAVDIGCGTGRHWDQILRHKPAALSGYDVSEEMLKRLRQKYPEARTWLLRGNTLHETADASTDAIISTLALAHIADLAAAFAEWNRILRSRGEVIMTDYHAAAFEKGGDRTFRHDRQLISIRNHIHSIKEIKRLTVELNWQEVEFMELKIDETLKHYYAEQNALHIYERFRNTPIIYGWRLKKA